MPPTGKENKGRFKKGIVPSNPFKKGSIPWNKGKKGYFLKPENKSSYRKRALRIYENMCHGCNNEDTLQVHHIDRNRDNGEDKNLMILCDRCHKKIHHLYNLDFSHFQSVLILRNYHNWDNI